MVTKALPPQFYKGKIKNHYVSGTRDCPYFGINCNVDESAGAEEWKAVQHRKYPPDTPKKMKIKNSKSDMSRPVAVLMKGANILIESEFGLWNTVDIPLEDKGGSYRFALSGD